MSYFQVLRLAIYYHFLAYDSLSIYILMVDSKFLGKNRINLGILLT